MRSPETSQRLTAARAAARERQVIPTFPRGCEVRPRGEAGRYTGRKGVVITYNLGEIGVAFDGKDQPSAWFLPKELERLDK